MPSPTKRRVRPRPEDVAPEDLQQLEVIHQLLRWLNDPWASQARIEQSCRALPVLGARVIAFAAATHVDDGVMQLGKALRLLGNRGVETVLLALLEDLTVLKADLEDAGERSGAGPA